MKTHHQVRKFYNNKKIIILNVSGIFTIKMPPHFQPTKTIFGIQLVIISSLFLLIPAKNFSPNGKKKYFIPSKTQ